MEKISKDILKDLLNQMYQLSSIGSLKNLRTVLERENFNTQEEMVNVNNVVGYAHLVGFSLAEINGSLAANYFAEARNIQQLKEVYRLAQMYKQNKTIRAISQSGVLNTLELPETIEEKYWRTSYRDPEQTNHLFYNYCENNDLVVLKVLQEGKETLRRCSWVYLVWDSDGIVKIYKEILDYNRGPLTGLVQNEDTLYSILHDNDLFPKLYGTVNINGTRFMRQSVHFGQTVADYIRPNEGISENDAVTIVNGIAQAFDLLHCADIAYLDTKPENLLVGQAGIRALDLGVSRRINGQEEIDIYLADPRFTTPEGCTKLKASKASDIFQLGILFHMLLTGNHPFETTPFKSGDTADLRESSLLRYALPTALMTYDSPEPVLVGTYRELISEMLYPNPQSRPDIKEVLECLSYKRQFKISRQPWQNAHQKGHNIVLFPARMGIPHKGHIEYISRLMELGYHILISVQRVHTITQRDPVPKSIVMKIVAQSLISRGLKPEVDFSFIATPYYRTRAEMELHYISIPQVENIIAVASGNPGVHDLLSEWPVFDQQSVFGREGETWPIKSWGEILRKAVREGDYKKFVEYAAEETEKVISFGELQRIYGKPEIEFAEKVDVVLLDNNKKEVVRGRVFRTHFPEQSLLLHMRNIAHWEVSFEDLYAKNSLVNVNGRVMQLCLVKTDFDNHTLHETIYYKLTGI